MKIAAASLTEEQLFDRVAGAIRDISGQKPEKIRREARLFEDLGIYGADGHDLFEALHEQFEMDWTGLDLGLHVGVEARAWPWQARERSDGFEPHPLTVDALMDALKAGRWPVYPRIEPPRGVAIRRQIIGWAAVVFVGGMLVAGLVLTLSRAGS